LNNNVLVKRHDISRLSSLAARSRRPDKGLVLRRSCGFPD